MEGGEKGREKRKKRKSGEKEGERVDLQRFSEMTPLQGFSKISEFLMSQFMLILSQQFLNVYNYSRSKVLRFPNS